MKKEPNQKNHLSLKNWVNIYALIEDSLRCQLSSACSPYSAV